MNLRTNLLRVAAGLALSAACARARADDSAVATDTAAARTPPRDACTLLPDAEAARVIGHLARHAAQGGVEDESRCLYTEGPASTSSVLVAVQWDAGATGMVAARAGLSALDADGVAEVPGLGDDAVVASQALPEIALPTGGRIGGGTAALWVRRGAVVVNVAVTMEPDARRKAIALARIVVAHL